MRFNGKYSNIFQGIISAVFLILFLFLVLKYYNNISAIFLRDWLNFCILIGLSICYYSVQGAILNELLKCYDIKLCVFEWLAIIFSTILFNLILPYSGLGLRAFYLNKKHSFRYSDFIYSLIVVYLIAMQVFAFGGIISCLYLPSFKHADQVHLLSIFLFIFFTASALLYFPLNFKPQSKFIARIFSFFSNIHEIRKKPKMFINIFFLTVLEYFLYAFLFYSALLNLGKEISLIKSLLPASLSSFAFIFRFTPGALLVNEGISAYGIACLGIPFEDAISAALYVRIALLAAVLLIGPVSIYYLLQNAKKSESKYP